MPTLLSANNYYYQRGGAEAVFLSHNRLFEQDGWTVVPFAMTHPRNLPTPWSKYFVDEIEFGTDYSIAGKLLRVTRVIYSVQARRRLAAVMDLARPDLCHAHNIYHHISPSILGLLKERRIPVVMTLHDLKIACPAYNMLSHDGICERCKTHRLYNVAIHRCVKGSTALSTLAMIESALHRLIGSYSRCVDRFVVPSRFYIGKLQEWGFPASRMIHVPNFVAASSFSPAFFPGKRVLYFGRISPEKGLHTLIRAAAKAQCKLTIVGTGPATAELQELATVTGANAEFLGYLSGRELHDAVRNSRAVVLPSEWYENAPMSILEAYALGKPVIGANIGGIPELVQDGSTGYLFTSGDVGSLADVLSRLRNAGDSTVETMGRQARQWVEQEFTTGNYRARIGALYDSLQAATSTPSHEVRSAP